MPVGPQVFCSTKAGGNNNDNNNNNNNNNCFFEKCKHSLETFGTIYSTFGPADGERNVANAADDPRFVVGAIVTQRRQYQLFGSLGSK